MLSPAAEKPADRAPLLGAETSDLPLARRGGAAIGRDDFLADAHRLASRLPESGEAVNYCSDRYHFAVGLVAAALRGQLTHLPHDRTSHSLHTLTSARSGLYCLIDGHDRPGGMPCIRVDGIPSGRAAERGVAALPRDQIVAMVYTGGTTGEPQPNAKTWGALTEGAWRIAKALKFDENPDATVVATVPAQHMYGLELSVLVPLCRAMPFCAEKPFYPADIERTVAEAAGPVVLVTTPIHLKALAIAKPTLTGLAKVVSATAPLADSLAERVEALFGAPVYEIYGCSEAGSLAARRTVSGSPWRTLEGIALRRDGGGCQALLPYLPEPVSLHDIIDPLTETEFLLRGRTSEIVNLAGKRASLSGLNAILNEIEGVADGVFYAPPEGENGEVQRLTAFVVAPGLHEAAIRRALREVIDPVFMPRPLTLVDELPRSATGKLNAAALERLAHRAHGKGP